MRKPTKDELIRRLARMRLSTEGDDATFAEEIAGEDDAVTTLDDLIEEARRIANPLAEARQLLAAIASDLREIEDKSARDPNNPRTFWVMGSFNLDLIEQAEETAKQ